jgi:hypothetical protein
LVKIIIKSKDHFLERFFEKVILSFTVFLCIHNVKIA